MSLNNLKILSSPQVIATTTMEEVMRGISSHTLSIFDHFPVKSVRLACLDHWRDDSYYDQTELTAENAQGRILRLKELKDPLWERLLEVYMYHHRKEGRDDDGSNAVKAVEFALSLIREGDYDHTTKDFVKLVDRKVRQRPSLYWLHEVRQIFCSFIRDMAGRDSTWDIMDQDWAVVRRSITLAQVMDDVDMLPLIQTIYTRLKEGDLKFWQNTGYSVDHYILPETLAFLATTIRLLEEESTRLINYDQYLQRYFEEKASLKGTVRLRLELTHDSLVQSATGESPTCTCSLGIEFSIPSEQERGVVRAVLQNLTTSCYGLGWYSSSKRAPNPGKRQESENIGKYPTTFILQPVLGTNIYQVTLTFSPPGASPRDRTYVNVRFPLTVEKNTV